MSEEKEEGGGEEKAELLPILLSPQARNVACSTPFGRSERNDGIIGGKWWQGERSLPAGDAHRRGHGV